MEMMLRLGIANDAELLVIRKSLLQSIASDLTKAERAVTVRLFNRLTRKMEGCGICVS